MWARHKKWTIAFNDRDFQSFSIVSLEGDIIPFNEDPLDPEVPCLRADEFPLVGVGRRIPVEQ